MRNNFKSGRLKIVSKEATMVGEKKEGT